MKKVLSLMLVILLALSALALPATAAGKAKTTVTLSHKGTVQLALNATLQLTATVTPEAAVTWKSSKKSVATVDEKGLVTPHKPGKATITAKAGGKTAKVTVKVFDPAKPTKLTINQGKKATLDIDRTLKLTAKLQPATAKSALTFKSSKPKVASVDESGLVKPLKEGTTKITVTAAANKKVKATITVKVVDPYKPTKVSITNGKSASLLPGESLKLGTTLSPSTAKSTLTFKSSKPKIASVNASGKITALKKGTAKITVTANNNKKAKTTFTVKVLSPSAFELAGWMGKPITRFAKKFNVPMQSKIYYVDAKADWGEDFENFYRKEQFCQNEFISAWGRVERKKNDSKLKSTTSLIESLSIEKASRYTLFGVKVGMDRATAYAIADAYGAAHFKKWNNGFYGIDYVDESEGEDSIEIWAPDGNCNFYIKGGKVVSIHYSERAGVL